MSQFEPPVEELFVRALLAIARADREIDGAEGERIDAVLRRRFPGVAIAELLFERTVRAEEVVKGLGAETEGGPYRNTTIPPAELGRMFVEDALAIVATHDGVSSAEEAALLRFAPLFGMPVHDVRKALAAATAARS
ncbi:MAG: TerB family tellurite resistance protein [Deltaproteobacteria bacterium]|nr:TerB family tellurite resistance protein [Deltaproteobacteria bacterium]